MKKLLQVFILIFLSINISYADFIDDANTEAQKLEKKLTLNPNDPDILHGLGGYYLVQKKYKEAEYSYQRALDIYEKSLGEDSDAVSMTLTDLAIIYQIQGKYKEAKPLYQRALDICENVECNKRTKHNLKILQSTIK